jgi:hypothetical protein
MTLGGREFTIPALDAVEWVRILTAAPLDTYAIFPILAGPEAVEAVEDAAWDGGLDEEDLVRMSLEAIAIAADRPWWVVLRLLSSVAGAWEHLHVNNARGMSLAGWLDEVWSKAVSIMDQKHRPAWEHQIEFPPKGWESSVDFNEEEKAFMSAMRSAQ